MGGGGLGHTGGGVGGFSGSGAGGGGGTVNQIHVVVHLYNVQLKLFNEVPTEEIKPKLHYHRSSKN